MTQAVAFVGLIASAVAVPLAVRRWGFRVSVVLVGIAAGYTIEVGLLILLRFI